MRRNFFIAFALLIVTSISLTAGGNQEGTDVEESVELSVWSGYPEMESFYKHAAEGFAKIHPNVSVEIVTHPLREFEQKLSATIPSDTSADILDVSVYAIQKFTEAGFIPKNPDNVNDFVNATGRYSTFAKSNNTYLGDMYGVPNFQGRTVLFWNKDMFAEAGLTGPPKTFDEMYEYAKLLAKYDDSGNLTRSGHSLRLSGQGSGVAEKWWFVLYPMGGTIIEEGSEAGKYHAAYNNKGGFDALKFYIDALYTDGWDSHMIKHDAEAFELEQTAMFFRESWVIGDIAKKAPGLNYDTAVVPSAARWGRITNIQNLYVTRASEYSDLAWEFILYCMSEENQQWLLENVGWLPARQDIDLEDIISRNPQIKAFLDSPAGYEEFGYIPIASFDELSTKLAERLVSAFLDDSLAGNDTAIRTLLAEAAEETNTILKKAGLFSE